jgi:DNA-directed RNA polymerase subunit RPC12/RpoP
MKLETRYEPGWGVVRVYTCSACGQESLLGPVDKSPGYGHVDEEAFTLLVIGDPPRCPDCRGKT